LQQSESLIIATSWIDRAASSRRSHTGNSTRGYAARYSCTHNSWTQAPNPKPDHLAAQNTRTLHPPCILHPVS
jgi:hypothetical protein